MRDTVQTKHNTAVWPVYNPTSPFLPTTTPSHIYCGFTRLLAHTLSPTLWIPLVWKAGPLSRGYSADVVGSLVTLSGSVAAQVWILPWESHAPPTRLQQQQLDSLQLLGLFIPPRTHPHTHSPSTLKTKTKTSPMTCFQTSGSWCLLPECTLICSSFSKQGVRKCTNLRGWVGRNYFLLRTSCAIA